MPDPWTATPDVADDDVPLTFCDQCGHLQIGLLYIAYAPMAVAAWSPVEPYAALVLVFVVLAPPIGFFILAAFHRMRSRDTWDEYRRWN